MSTPRDATQRARLVEALWALKQGYRKTGGTQVGFVQFNLLLADEHYRESVLADAERANDPTLRRLAGAARELNLPGTLMAGPRQPRTPDVAAAAPAIQPGGVSNGRGRFHTGVAMVAVLVALVGGVLGFVVAGTSGLTLGGPTQVSGSIVSDTVWSAERPIELQGIVYVEGGAKLTIEAGATVLGTPGAALVVTREGSLYARGRPDAPVVFTSARPPGERKRGDWGGVVLLGSAPVNRPNPQIEGLDPADTRGYFGGADAGSNCGVLEYVRIEFAGYEIGADNELNGLTLGGCGYTTILRHIQVHKALDDGIEFFGGNADLRNVIVSGAGDDGLDWDMGWTGRVQFFVAQQHDDDGDNAIEADNDKDNPDGLPMSQPLIYNITLVGANNPRQAHRGMTLRRGTGGVIRNLIMTGFPVEAIDFQGAHTAARFQSGALDIGHAVLAAIGPDGRSFFQAEAGDADDDNAFDEMHHFVTRVPSVRFDEAPLLANPYDPLAPDFTPAVQSPAATGAAVVPKGEFWDEAANYLGAIRPGSTTDWLQGWTAFPVD